ncbi:lipoprotein, partial [human gut metagenome]
MTSFLDERTRYMQRIVLRDAEANARFFFTFPVGKARLVDTLTENRRQIAAVRSLTRGLMTDPVYIIDSITLRATASPEGTWVLNDRLARDRAEALRQVLVSEFRTLYDSLRVAGSYTLDEAGHQVLADNDDRLPDLPNLLRTTWL